MQMLRQWLAAPELRVITLIGRAESASASCSSGRVELEMPDGFRLASRKRRNGLKRPHARPAMAPAHVLR